MNAKKSPELSPLNKAVLATIHHENLLGSPATITRIMELTEGVSTLGGAAHHCRLLVSRGYVARVPQGTGSTYCVLKPEETGISEESISRPLVETVSGNELTTAERRLLLGAQAAMSKTGVAPTLSEMNSAAGFSKTSRPQNSVVASLVEQGYLEPTEHGRRAFHVLKRIRSRYSPFADAQEVRAGHLLKTGGPGLVMAHLAVQEAFKTQGGPPTVSQIAAETPWKVTTHWVVAQIATLVKLGYLERNPRGLHGLRILKKVVGETL